MSEERFDRLEEKFDRFGQWFQAMDRRLDRLDERFEAMDQQLDRFDERFDAMDQRLDRFDERFDAMDQRLEAIDMAQRDLRDHVVALTGEIHRLDDRIETLDRHMRTLYEDLRRDFAALGEYESPLRREMRQAFAELNERLGRRLDPLEIAVQHHSKDIAELRRNPQ